ncbi:ABC transporter permease [Breoghania sp.]|uniref:ABC transporter permease n=1 Tax=Breoghania sp. TaxID=2065378 RepID=UPI0029CA9B38|nr:ABC transporter permease [Breoghania sp.]
MRRNGLFANAFIIAFALFMVAPIAIVVGVAFTPTGHLEFPPSGISLRWFRAILDNPDFIEAAITSLQIGVLSATLAMFLAVPAALAITRGHFPGREALLAFLMSPLMVPTVVLGIAFLRFLTMVGLTGSFMGLVLCHVIIVLPYGLRLVLASLTGLDRSVEKAAIALGASNWTVFHRIVLPSIIPGIVGGWVLAFITSFDEVTVTVFIVNPSTTTLPVRLFNHIAQTTDPLVASVSAVAVLFTVGVMIVVDRLYGLDRLLLEEGKNDS